MAFEYTPYRNPYIGTIADLMARGEDAKAKALVDVANAQARAAEIRGQAYGGAVQSIGQIASKALTDYTDPKRKLNDIALKQAESNARLDDATRDVLSQTIRPVITTTVPGVPFEASSVNVVPPTPQGVGSRAFGGVSFGAPVQARTPQSLFGRTEVGTQTVVPDSTFVQSQGPERQRFNDPGTGLFDINEVGKAFGNLRDKDGRPFSPAQIASRLEPIQKINESVLDYDAKQDSLEKSKQVAFGTMADGVIKYVEANGGSYIDAARLAVIPWERRLGKDAVDTFLENFGKLSRTQQRGQLDVLRNQAASLLPNKTLAEGAIDVDAFGREIARGGVKALPNPTRASFLRDATDPTKTPEERAIAQKNADDLKPVVAVPRNSDTVFNVKGLGNVPLTVELGPSGQQTRYFYESPTGRVEKFAGVDFTDKPQASVVLQSGVDVALGNIPSWATTAERPPNTPESNIFDKVTGLTPNSAYQLAVTFLDTGQVPQTGRANSPLSIASQRAIQAKASAIAADAGMDVPEFRATFQANRGALSKTMQSQAAVSTYIATADKNAEQVLAVLDKIPDGSPLLNGVARSLSSLGGNVDMSEFNVYLKSVKTEYGKIISQPNLTGVLTDNARKEASSLLPDNATVGQIRTSLRALKSEGTNRVTSLAEEVLALKSGMTRNLPVPASSEPVVPASSGNTGRVTVTFDKHGNLVREP